MQGEVTAKAGGAEIFVDTAVAEWRSYLAGASDVVIASWGDRDAGYGVGISGSKAESELLDVASRVIGGYDRNPDSYYWIDTVAVVPHFRGKGLQLSLMEFLESRGRQMGAEVALATVSPSNHFSLSNFQRHGYEILAELLVYGGLRRLLLSRAL